MNNVLKNKKKMILIGIAVAMIILLVIGYIFLFTDIFKSKNERFEKKFLKLIEQAENICDFSNEKQYLKYLKERNYEDNTKIALRYKDNEQLNIEILGNTDNLNQKSDRDISITYGDTNTPVLDMKFLKEDQMYGIMFEDIVNYYICVDSDDIEEVISKLDFKQEEIKNCYDKLSQVENVVNNLIENNLNSTILDFIKQIDDSQCNIQEDRIITLSNSESITTTAYVLKLTAEQTKQLYEAINEKLPLSQINELGESEEAVITINVLSNKVARATIELENITLRVDFYDNNLNIKIDNYVENELQTINIIITKEDNKKTIQYENYNEDKLIIEQTILNSTNNTIANTNITYSGQNIENIGISIKQTITLKEDVNIESSFENPGMVILNNCEKDIMNRALNNLGERLQNRLTTVQNKVQSELLKEILEQNNNINSNYEKNLEDERQKFNSQFTPYEGTVKQNIVLNLVDVAEKYINNYQIIGNEKIKIYVNQESNQDKKDDDETSEIIEEIRNKVKENEQYKVTFEYDNNSKISVIILEKIIEEKKE